MEEIGSYAFRSCTSLGSIKIPKTVKEIGRSAFEGCQALRSIIIPNGIKRNGYTVFKGCKSLESVDLPNLPSTLLGYKWDFTDCNNMRCINVHLVSDERNVWKIIQCGINVEIQFIEDERYNKKAKPAIEKFCQELEEMCNDTTITARLKESSSDNSEQVSVQKKVLTRNIIIGLIAAIVCIYIHYDISKLDGKNPFDGMFLVFSGLCALYSVYLFVKLLLIKSKQKK